MEITSIDMLHTSCIPSIELKSHPALRRRLYRRLSTLSAAA